MPSLVGSPEIQPIYRALLAQVQDAVFIVCPEDRIIDASARAEALFGYSVVELQVLMAADLAAPADRDTFQDAIDRVQAGETVPVFEASMRRADGSEFPADVTLTVILDETGKPGQSLAIIHDLSDRKAGEQLEYEQHRVYLFDQFATLALAETPLDTLVSKTVEALYRVFPQYRVSFSLVEDNVLTIQHSAQPAALPSTQGMRMMVGDLWASVTSHGSFEPLVIDDMSAAPRVRSVLETSLPSVSQALLGIPLHYGDSLVGMVALNSSAAHVWQGHEISLMREAAAYLSMAIGAALERQRREKIDARMRVSEWRYRTVINNFPNVSVSLFDPDLRVLVAGGGAMAVANLTIESVEGKTVHDLFPPPMISLVEPLMRDALAGKPSMQEMSFLGFTFDAHFLPIRDDDGKVIAGMAVSTDITAQTRAVEDLAEKHHLLQTIIDSVPGHIFVKDLDGRFVAVNAAVYNTLGMQPGALIGKTDFDIYPEYMASAYVADDQMVIATGQPLIDREEHDQDGEGRVRTILTSKVPMIDRHGKITGIIGQVQNITERKRWELELRRERDFSAKILDITSALIFVLDDQGRFVSFNHACERLSGYTVDEVLGRTPEFLLFPDNIESVHLEMAEIFNGKTLENYVNQWRQKDGGARTILWSSQSFTSLDGTIYILASGVDISERSELEKRNLELALEREKIRFLHEFIRDVSHDLQTPLSVLNSNMSMMRRTTDPERQEKRILVMEQQVTRLIKLIDQLLTMSRLDSPDEVDRDLIDLSEISRHVALAFRKTAHERQLTLAADVAQEPLYIIGDSQHLSLALSNLLENALRYAKTTAKIHVYRLNDEIIADISDDGPGIQAEDLPLIFERFYRADKARSTETGGTGLGLSIAKKIAELHAGRIEVESVVGQGSRFRLVLVSL